MRLPRVAVVCDLIEEDWPSMALVADQLLEHLRKDQAGVVEATRICPPLNRRFTTQRSEGSGQRSAIGARFNVDRFLNRFWDYPRYLRTIRNEFDLFHLVDHSYAQLLHHLPGDRTIVTCHDLDTFQCLLNPGREPRSVFFRKMMERTLSGFRKSAFVTCDSSATRDELFTHKLALENRTAVIANGVHPSCSPQPDAAADAAANRLIGQWKQKGNGEAQQNSEVRTWNSEPGLELLHVGSTIPRKRIDVLLRVFARVKELFPCARMLRVGGDFTAEQAALAEKLRIKESIVVLPPLDRNVLAAVYRRAALVLLPSEREGFGLPVVEAMACGTPVVASDLAVLREVGGKTPIYCEMGNIEVWTETISSLVREKDAQPKSWQQRRDAGLSQAEKFSWAEYAKKMVTVYQAVSESKHRAGPVVRQA